MPSQVRLCNNQTAQNVYMSMQREEIPEFIQEDEASESWQIILSAILPVIGRNQGYRNSRSMAISSIVQQLCKEEDLWICVAALWRCSRCIFKQIKLLKVNHICNELPAVRRVDGVCVVYVRRKTKHDLTVRDRLTCISNALSLS